MPPQTRDSQKMQSTSAVKAPAANTTTDLNEQLRQDTREIRSLADKYLIEEGRVILRSTIPAE